MKFSGKVGFWVEDVETVTSVYEPNIVEKTYFGEVLKNTRRFQSLENQQNKNLNITSRISIISDLFIQKNWPSIRYVEWNGVKWEVKSVDITAYPRAVLELGGVYNGN